jgi:glutathione synthase
VDFTPAVIEDLERKVRLREHYGADLSNIRLATI